MSDRPGGGDGSVQKEQAVLQSWRLTGLEACRTGHLQELKACRVAGLPGLRACKELEACRAGDLQSWRLAECKAESLQNCRCAELEACRIGGLQSCRLARSWGLAELDVWRVGGSI